MEKASYKTIGVFANWYAMVENRDNENILMFKAVDDAFTAGYLSMENYVCTITGDINDVKESSFSIPIDKVDLLLPNWVEILTVNTEFLGIYILKVEL